MKMNGRCLFYSVEADSTFQIGDAKNAGSNCKICAKKSSNISIISNISIQHLLKMLIILRTDNVGERPNRPIVQDPNKAGDPAILLPKAVRLKVSIDGEVVSRRGARNIPTRAVYRSIRTFPLFTELPK